MKPWHVCDSESTPSSNAVKTVTFVERSQLII